MVYKEIKVQEIPCISFMKGTRWHLYVGPTLSWFERRKLMKVASRYSIIYLPGMCRTLSKEQLNYTFPGVDFPDGFSLQTIFTSIRENIGVDIRPDSRLIIKYDGKSYVVFDAKSSIDLLISYLVHKGDEFMYDDVEDDLLYREAYESSYDEFGDVRCIEEPCLDFESCEEVVKKYQEEDVRFRVYDSEDKPSISPRVESGSQSADDRFDTEMSKTAQEVEKQIKKLLLDGFPAEIIQSWLNETVKLSKLRITRQFRILLVDYDKEIKMGPLPKTVFLFYLRHPEGVKFSYLQDHIAELSHIYGHVSVNDDPHKMYESIVSLTDPFSNSICEKCSAVKTAFVLQVNDNVARNYYITGMQGGKKSITLNRNLVEWECEL